ncbi:MAG: autotransporter-associated beta strand repeat-containing protein [Verrucomicrobiaceae bacterium]|nr:autotransporter-associated beta strand repeat-containing protein [Verrucomicrobiaceae bacterium]
MKNYVLIFITTLALAGSVVAQTVFTSSTTLNTNGQALGPVTINSGVTVDGNAGVTVTAEASEVLGTLLAPTGFTYNSAGYNMDVGRTVGSTGTLSLSGGNVTTNSVIAGHDGGTGTVNLNGGTLTTTTIERWTGGSTLNFAGGTLRAAADHPALINGYTLGALITTGAGAIIDTNGFNVGINSTFSGAGGLTKTGAGTLTLNADSVYTGGTIISAGTLQLGSGGTSGNLTTSSISNAGTLAINRSDNLTLGMVITGAGSLTKSGAGTLTLTGANTYSGITDVTAGSLEVAGGSITHTGSFLKVQNAAGAGFSVSGGTVNVNASYIGFNLGQAGAATLNSGSWVTGSLELGYFTQSTGTVTQNGGTLFSPLVVLGRFDGTGHLHLNGGVLETREIARNSLASSLTADGGTLRIYSYSPTLLYGFTSGSAVIQSGGLTIDTRSFLAITPAELTGPGGLTKTGTGTLMLAGDSTFSGTMTIAEGTLQLGDGGVSGFITANSISNSGLLVVYRSGSITLGMPITGTGRLRNLGTGTLTLTGASTYSGGTEVIAGSLVIADGSITHSSSNLTVQGAAGASFSVNGGSVSVATSYIGYNQEHIGAATLNSGTWSSSVAVALGFSGDATGMLTLNGGTLTSPQVSLGILVGTGTLILNGGVLETESVARYSLNSSFTANGGTLRARANTNALLSGFTSGSAVIQSGGLTIDTNNFNASSPAELTGAGGLTKTGAGTLTLSGTSSYTGPTTVNTGILSLSQACLADTARVSITSAGIMHLDHGHTDTVASLIIDGVPQAAGIWGAVGSGAQHETARITGTGRLLVIHAFADWSARFGLTGPDALPTADADTDGVLNLLEFHTGGSPVSASPVATTLLKTPTGIDFTYPRAKNITGVTAIVEWTDDLVTWSSSGVSPPTVITDQGVTEVVKVTVPAGSGTGRFVRLRVTSP